MVNCLSADEKVLFIKKSFSIFFPDVKFEKFFDVKEVYLGGRKCLRLSPKSSSCINAWWMHQFSVYYSMMIADGYLHLLSVRNILLFYNLFSNSDSHD